MEDAQVKRLMVLHGIERVRGGSYCSFVLSPENIDTLTQELRHAQNLCMRCGHAGHYAKVCDADFDVDGIELPTMDWVPSKCFRCGRTSHWTRDCYAGTHADGRVL